MTEAFEKWLQKVSGVEGLRDTIYMHPYDLLSAFVKEVERQRPNCARDLAATFRKIVREFGLDQRQSDEKSILGSTWGANTDINSGHRTERAPTLEELDSLDGDKP